MGYNNTGDSTMKRNYKEFINNKIKQYGVKFDTSDLNEEFIPYFENGERIAIKFNHGEIKRGTIGISSGWRPCFLLMLTKRSIGSCYTINKKDEIKRIGGV